MDDLIAEVKATRQLPDPVAAREIRRAAGVSRERLAEALGVHKVTVARWERGTRHPYGELRVRYARLLLELREVVKQ